jgi:hypothetical protein
VRCNTHFPLQMKYVDLSRNGKSNKNLVLPASFIPHHSCLDSTGNGYPLHPRRRVSVSDDDFGDQFAVLVLLAMARNKAERFLLQVRSTACRQKEEPSRRIRNTDTARSPPIKGFLRDVRRGQ